MMLTDKNQKFPFLTSTILNVKTVADKSAWKGPCREIGKSLTLSEFFKVNDKYTRVASICVVLVSSQLTFTCSKTIIKRLEKDVKYVQTKYISHFFPVFLLVALNKSMLDGIITDIRPIGSDESMPKTNIRKSSV